MGSALRECAPPLVEPVPVGDTFVTGLGLAEPRGDFVRLTFFSERCVVEAASEFATAPPAEERTVEARLVLTPDRLRRIVRQMQDLVEQMDRHAARTRSASASSIMGILRK